MPSVKLNSFTCLATLCLLSHCSAGSSTPNSSTDGVGPETTSSGSPTSSGGPTSAGGTTTSGGGSAGMSGVTSSGSASGGTAGVTATGGTTSSSNASGGTGSVTSTGGMPSSGGTMGGTVGTTSSGGMTSSSTGTTGGTVGTTTSGGVIKDQGGVPLAKAGDSTSTSRQYLNLGDIRLINNRWGSDAINCGGTTQKVYVNADGTLGWDFNRPTCGGMRADPDFPEVEFGVAPFGTQSSLLTTPPFSSTTVLPIQLKDLTSASVTINNFSTTFSKPGYWDSNFEFWISRQDPRTSADAGVYAEIIAFLGWENGRNDSSAGGWTCDKSGNVTSGGTGYNLCHQSDTWSGGKWRFFNFNVNNGSLSTFSGKVDIKAFIDWVTKNYSGFTTDMWLTRIEIGTEIDDDTAG